jgi:hypothetical protein
MIAGNIAFVFAAMGTGGSLQSGTYSIKAYLVKFNGTLLYSTEITASGGPGTKITLTLPVAAQTGNYWIIYFGIGAGNENEFVQVLSSQTTVTISAPGIAGIPGSSNGWLTRLFCYDLVLKAWSVVDLPFPISVPTNSHFPPLCRGDSSSTTTIAFR